MNGGDGWVCPAYGDDPAVEQAGALCFFAGPGERLCETEPECHGRLVVERVRVHDRITELAAGGDPTAQYLAEAIGGPEELLGGPAAPPPQDGGR